VLLEGRDDSLFSTYYNSNLNIIAYCFYLYILSLFYVSVANLSLHGMPSAWVLVFGMIAERKVSPSSLKTPLRFMVILENLGNL